jgi:hypothetical protein
MEAIAGTLSIQCNVLGTQSAIMRFHEHTHRSNRVYKGWYFLTATMQC